MSAITIRRARITDLPLLQKFEREFDRDQRKIVLSKAPKQRPYLRRPAGRGPSFTKWMRKWLRSYKAIVLIAESSGGPVGFSASWIVVSPSFFVPRKSGYVGYLFVRSRYRGRRASSLMMEETLYWFAKRKVKHVSLNVFADNEPARGIYEKWGFVDTTVFAWKQLRKAGPSLRSG